MTDFAEPSAPIEMALPDVAPPKPVKSDWSATEPVGSDWKRHGDGAKAREDRRSTIASARAKVEGKYAGQNVAASLRDKRPSNATVYSAQVRQERRGAIEKAVAAGRDRDTAGRYQTKQERLADRVTGSELEKRAIKASVAKAAEKVGAVPTREESNAARGELRKAVETLRQRYPGKSASDFVKIAKEWDAAYRADPVGTREKMLEAYAKVSPENFRDHQAPEKAKGARGSVRQAMRDHEEMADLAQFEKEFGHRLPAVLSELVRHDEAMVRDPVGTSARLAANYGAPVTPTQEAAYMQRRQQEQARTEQSKIVHHGLSQIIERKLLPGLDDDNVLHAIADVLESKDFKRTGDRGKDLESAHAQVMAARSKAPVDDRGTKSISGAPSAGQGGRSRGDRGTGSVRDSINRARG